MNRFFVSATALLTVMVAFSVPVYARAGGHGGGGGRHGGGGAHRSVSRGTRGAAVHRGNTRRLAYGGYGGYGRYGGYGGGYGGNRGSYNNQGGMNPYGPSGPTHNNNLGPESQVPINSSPLALDGSAPEPKIQYWNTAGKSSSSLAATTIPR